MVHSALIFVVQMDHCAPAKRLDAVQWRGLCLVSRLSNCGYRILLVCLGATLKTKLMGRITWVGCDRGLVDESEGANSAMANRSSKATPGNWTGGRRLGVRCVVRASLEPCGERGSLAFFPLADWANG
jgi:hypothetical protein